MNISNRATNIIASCLLIFVFLITIFSVKNDSLTMDEVAHLPAGYSYLTQQDMRLNPEHPPLLKDLAAVPLLFIKDINFPSNIQSWQEDINGQWDFGFHFLYESNNPAEQMIFWGRIPMILILVLLGFYVFKWARELFGNCAGLLALFFFSFSPTFLAHGRLVTTDLGAAAGVFIATYYFIRALKSPIAKNIVFAGIAFGIAQLLKFSVILLLPFFVLIAFVWWLLKMEKLGQTLKILVLVFVIGFLLIWPIYQYHILNYPAERQARDAEVYLAAYPDFIKDPLVWMAEKPILRPYSQYLTGLFMVFNRVTAGHTTYFMGEISNLGWRNYFPIVYAIKVPLAFHILTILALIFSICLIRRNRSIVGTTKEWLKSNFPQFAMVTFIAVYWAASLVGTLNIGVRHLMPTFPFMFLLVSWGTISWLKAPRLKLKYLLVLVLIIWQGFTVVSLYPHFLAYFNETAGGPDKGYLYTVDSNLDWGQDLKRLNNWAEENNVEKIYVNYFGGSDPEYYLGKKYAPWWGDRSPEDLPSGSYLAVSATFLQGGQGVSAPGFDQPTGQYLWLGQYTPIAKIGYSIFVFKID